MHYTNYYYRPVRKKRMKRNFSSKPGNFWKWAAAAAVPAAIMAGKYLLTGDASSVGDAVGGATGVTIPDGPEIKIDNGLPGGVPVSQGRLTVGDLHTVKDVSHMPPSPQNMSRSSTRLGNLYGLNFSRYYPRVFSENFASAAGTGVLPVAVAAGSDPQTAPYVAMPMQPNDYQRYPVLTKVGHMAGGMLKGGALGFVPAAAALGAGSVLNNDVLFNTGVGIAVGAPIIGGVGGYLYGKALADYDPYEYLQRKR
jgi:hypothetical protein